MDTDVKTKTDAQLYCFLHCDRSAVKETHSPYGRARHKISPEGLDIDMLGCSISQAVKEYFIRVYQRSSVFILLKCIFFIDNTAKMAAARKFHSFLNAFPAVF